MFAAKLTFTSRGEKSYKTSIGAIASIVVLWITLLYGFVLMMQMVNKTKAQTTQGISYVSNIYKDKNSNFTVNDKNLYLVFDWRDSINDNMFDNGYGYIKLFKRQYWYNEDNQLIRSTSITYNASVPWNETNFPSDNFDEYTKQVIAGRQWVFLDDHKLTSNNTYKEEFGCLVFPWTGANCPSNTTESIVKSTLKLYLINNYYDVNDPGNPIKSRLEPGATMTFRDGTAPTINIYAKNNFYKVYDGWIQIVDPSPKSFYTLRTEIQSIQEYTDDLVLPGEFSYGMVRVKIEQSELGSYETTVINILDVFGLMGGVFELLQITSSLVISIVTSYYFHKDITEKTDENVNELFSYPPFYKNDSKYQGEVERDFYF